jgi:hypothetical protein
MIELDIVYVSYFGDFLSIIFRTNILFRLSSAKKSLQTAKKSLQTAKKSRPAAKKPAGPARP